MCDIVVKKFTFAISSPDEFLFTSPPVGMRNIVIGVYVCLFVGLFACPLAYRINHGPNFTNFLYMSLVAVAQSSSDGNAMCYDCRVFPVFWMTSCRHIAERMGRIIRDDNDKWRHRGEVCRLSDYTLFIQ